MFQPASRYYHIETATLATVDAAGQPAAVRYKRRRFIPAAEGQTVLSEHTMVQGDRLDNIAARYLGDPVQYWRICDANLALSPEELEQTGRVVRIVLSGL